MRIRVVPVGIVLAGAVLSLAACGSTGSSSDSTGTPNGANYTSSIPVNVTTYADGSTLKASCVNGDSVFVLLDAKGSPIQLSTVRSDC